MYMLVENQQKITYRIMNQPLTWSVVWLFVIPWTIAYQAPPSMESFRPEYWSGWPFPSPADLSNLGIEPRSHSLKGRHFTLWATREAPRSGVEGNKIKLENHFGADIFWLSISGKDVVKGKCYRCKSSLMSID